MGEIKILKLINKFFKKEEDKIKAKYIYIQVDEDHIKERNKKCCTISKIVIIYTRKKK